MIRIGAETASNLREGLRREWLETNGLGGFASGTVCGANTRRYHGLLIAAMRPPLGRQVLISKLEDELVVDGKRTPLSSNIYPGTVHPRGHERIVEFRIDPFPTWVYEAGDVRVEKSIFLVYGEHTVVVSYRLVPGPSGAFLGAALLELSPLIAFRDFHSLTHENTTLDARVRWQEGRVALTPYAGLPTLYIEGGAERVEATGYWYRNFEFKREAESGAEFHEDVFCPCRLVYHLRPGEPAAFVATLESTPRPEAGILRVQEIERRSAAATVPGANDSDPALRTLSLAAENFIVRRGDSGVSVIGGYPWLADWGRITCVALPGLTLERGRTEAARQILLTLASLREQGVIPDFYTDDTGQPEFRSVDTSLWFVQAVREYFEATRDTESLRTGLYRAVSDVLRAYRSGTRPGVRVTADGLLEASHPDTQLTWMDARVDEWAVTPRRGQAVEVNALWYTSHLDAAELALAAGCASEASGLLDEGRRIAESFDRTFWNADRRCLFDVVDGDSRDATLRPNQIFAVSLPHSPLPADHQRAVVETVRDHLLTPFGLRSIGPSEPGYVGIYTGNKRLRYAAYHQGTVWPYLMGPFVTAYLRVFGRTEATLREAEGFLRPLIEFANGRGLTQIPEIFDGDPPHKPRGCVAHAWSVAEVLRAWRLVKRG